MLGENPHYDKYIKALLKRRIWVSFALKRRLKVLNLKHVQTLELLSMQ